MKKININTQAFFAAIDEMVETKGLRKEDVIEALKEAFRKAFSKHLLGGGDDALVKVIIDETDGILVGQLKTVMNDEDIEDDYLQISLEDALELDPNAKIGDEIEVPTQISDEEELSKSFVQHLKSVFTQKIKDAEKAALFLQYKDKVGEIVTGTVESVNARSVVVSLDKMTLTLQQRDLIGSETFFIGDPIKVYLADASTNSKDSMIHASRSHEGFLRRLFEEEIHEIYDGTVIIKNIVREAGVRAKVAVTSKDKDVDATGACIGKDGQRILNIVSQLGNSEKKEKIDIIEYSENPALYIIEAIRPATVVGIHLEEIDGTKNATVIVNDSKSLLLAIGRRGANVRLAVKLTGWNIEILEEAIAIEDAVEYMTIAEVERLEGERVREKAIEEMNARTNLYKKNAGISNEEKVAEILDEQVTVEKVVENAVNVETTNDTVEIVKEEVEIKETVKPVKVTLETTTTLESLEKELEKSTSKSGTKTAVKSKRPRKITEEEVANESIKVEEVAKRSESKIKIYTEEELKAFEEEEVSSADYYDEDEVDYDEYDSFYDDDK